MSGDYIVAQFFDGVDGYHSSEANAKLYSSAPKMLEYLIEEYLKMYKVYNMDKLKNIIEEDTGLSIEEVINERNES